MINAHSIATRKCIEAALVTVIQGKGFKALTVADLLRQAKVSRGTFYRYYLDKYDLLDQCEDQLMTDMQAIFDQYPKPNLMRIEETPPANAFYVMMKVIYQHRRAISTLVNCPETTLLAKIKQLIGDKLIVEPSSELMGTKPTSLVSAELAKALIVENIVTILTYWLGQTPMVAPTSAYEIFLRSRLLSPVDLAEIMVASASIEQTKA
ncbi:TetR/AcrR family transcriptional regulator [Lactiplantibacillus pingfangensis]|uniref:TetR/AcrR family transcriptional regulator n=1 Tax=Lactiplantibacillus pingfangensis TaxID=2559915 RepID=UPI0010F8A9B5|nr:TetR family transcriptional regulator [Lactiplantibacillus pingfangensis]